MAYIGSRRGFAGFGATDTSSAKKCFRCGGGQILTQFKHVDGGACFRCGASGVDPGTTYGGGSTRHEVSPEMRRDYDAEKKRRIKEFLDYIKESLAALPSLERQFLVAGRTGNEDLEFFARQYESRLHSIGLEMFNLMGDDSDLAQKALQRLAQRLRPDQYAIMLATMEANMREREREEAALEVSRKLKRRK